MRKTTLSAVLALASAVQAQAASHDKPFTGTDLSGVYACTGHDSRDGDYRGTVTLILDREHSHGKRAAYRLKMDANGEGSYTGAVAAAGDLLAVSFANDDVSKKDYGVGVGKVNRKSGSIGFGKFYYEPDYQGGDDGMETCVRR